MSYEATIKTIKTGVVRDGVDTSVALRIRYIGSEVAAHVSVDHATDGTCDMKFEQGATTALAATTTGTNPIAPVGGTVGIIDMSDASVDTLAKLVRVINAATDWEAWLEDAPGDEAVEASAGVGLFPASSDSDCTVAAGYAVVLDTSLLTAEEFFAGITQNGPSNTPHPHDANVEHDLIEIRATATYTGGSQFISVYACDDVNGTAELIWGPVPAAATTVEKVINLSGNPITGTDGRRISVKFYNDTGAHTVTSLVLARETRIKGPALRSSKMWATREI
jgi:hypothetical protein